MFLPRHACRFRCRFRCRSCRTRRPIRPLILRPRDARLSTVFPAFVAFFTILRRRLFIALTYSYCTLVQYLSFCPISFLLPNIFPAVPLSPTFAPLYACARSVPRSSYRRTVNLRQRKKGLSPLIRSAIIRVPPRCSFYLLSC